MPPHLLLVNLFIIVFGGGARRGGCFSGCLFWIVLSVVITILINVVLLMVSLLFSSPGSGVDA